MSQENLSQMAASPANPSKLTNYVDQLIDDLSKNVLSTAPYLVRLHYDRHTPALHPPAQQYWSHGTPFSPEEEDIQWVTFHQQPGGLPQTFIHCLGQWDDGRGGFAQPEQSQSRSSSGQTPLRNQEVKKAIPWMEYKKRDRSKAPPKEAIGKNGRKLGEEQVNSEAQANEDQEEERREVKLEVKDNVTTLDGDTVKASPFVKR